MNFVVPYHIRELLRSKSMRGAAGEPRCELAVRSVQTGNIWKSITEVVSLRVSRVMGEADILSVEIDNKNGKYSPEKEFEGNAWLHVFTPNTEINLRLGYGEDMVQYFRGYIDDVNMSAFPASINLDCRSKYKKALDNTITYVEGGKKFRTVEYLEESIEDIFIDLAVMAGWGEGEIVIEEDPNSRTGILLERKEFSWQTYADAFTELSEISQFEVICDEWGSVKLLAPTISQPAIINQEVDLTSGYYMMLGVDDIILGSELVISLDKSKTYKRGVDYHISKDEVTKDLKIEKLPGGSIEGKVLLSYVYPAHSFEEGVDLVSINYTLSDSEAYAEVIVFGEKEVEVINEDGEVEYVTEVVEGSVSYTDPGYGYYGTTMNKLYNQPNKVLKIDSTIAQTDEQCKILAERAMKACIKRYRGSRHVAVANPWLILGDTIKVFERSTSISEAYRISAMDISMDTGGFLMDITAYHVGNVVGGN